MSHTNRGAESEPKPTFAPRERVEQSMMDFKTDFSTWDPEDRKQFLAELKAVDLAFRKCGL